MIIRTALLIVLFSRIFPRPVSGLPSPFNATTSSIRAPLPDESYLIQFKDSDLSNTQAYLARLASAATFPALSLPDVQSAMNKVTLFPDREYPAHLHPRASELLFVLRGEVDVVLGMEGIFSDRRILRNSAGAGQAVAVPQGLAHGVKCTSQTPCNVIAFFNSADPGYVPGKPFPAP